MTAGRARALRLTEAVLLAAGLGLAAWCTTILVEARYVNSIPIVSGAPSESAAPPAIVPLSKGDLVAHFEAPSVHLSANVLEGSSDDVLAIAAGHIEGTAMPGAAGNVGIAGHRDTTFRAVRNLKVGDPILLATKKGVFDYRIESMQIVMPDAVWVLDPTDRPVLTLVTCYPFTFIGHAPKRYIVKARLVGTR
jgi:sortase A